jgi:septum formation protein
MQQARQLVLASGSRYRRELLARLGLAFETCSPDIDEQALPGEALAETAARLAQQKAQAAAAKFPGALIVGSDQVAACAGLRLGKPGDHANAVRQLRSLSGRVAEFHTAVALLDTATRAMQCRVVPCRVVFRKLSAERIEAYLRREQPYDCAGSARAEALGIALIARIESDDPSALIGLPLIALTEMLERAGLPVLP